MIPDFGDGWLLIAAVLIMLAAVLAEDHWSGPA